MAEYYGLGYIYVYILLLKVMSEWRISNSDVSVATTSMYGGGGAGIVCRDSMDCSFAACGNVVMTLF